MTPRPHLLAALLILAVLGCLWTRTRPQPLGLYDQSFYLGIAYDLVHHGRFTDGFRFAGGDDTTPRPPGMRFTPLYPAFLAASASVSPDLRAGMDCIVRVQGRGATCSRRAGPVRVLQFLMLAGCYWMIWWNAARYARRIRTGWIALGLALLTAPLLLLSVDYLMTEIVSLFLFLLATTLASRGLDGGTYRARYAAAAGLALGLAVLVRPGFMLLAEASLLCGLVLAAASHRARRRHLLLWCGFAAGSLAPILAWVLRNLFVMGRAALTYGYASHTLVQRISFDSMSWRQYGLSFVCWLPDGNGIGKLLSGARACDPFGWDDHPDSFYAIGIGPMLVQTLRASGGYAHHMSYLLHHYLLRDPGWHVLVTIPLALRGLYVDHYWGLVLGPVCAVMTIAAVRRQDGRFLLLALPAWFMLLFNASVAVNQVRYNLMLILPLSLSGALAVEGWLRRRSRR